MNGIAPTRLNGRLVRIVGWLIVATALFYVGQRLAANFDKISTVEVTAGRLFILSICAVGYAAILIPLAIVWGRLANADNPSPPSVWQSISIYGRAQFAKYIPGNIFHYAGRQVLGRQLGWSQSGMAMASVLEIPLIAAAAALVVLAYGILVEGSVFSLIPETALTVGLVVCVVAPCLLVAAAHRIPMVGKLLPPGGFAPALQGYMLPSAFVVYLAYFAAAGGLCWLTLEAVGITAAMDLFPVVAAGFVGSWLVGYLTPGASGGIGVREAALTLLLAGSLGEPNAIALALALRIATTFGDLLNFVASSLIHRKLERPSP